MLLPLALALISSPLLAASWKPFLTTMPIASHWGQSLLALPLCLGVAIVYKTTKCNDAADVPRESAILFLWIVLGLIAAAAIVQLVILMN